LAVPAPNLATESPRGPIHVSGLPGNAKAGQFKSITAKG
jgi:hypothetical protein